MTALAIVIALWALMQEYRRRDALAGPYGWAYRMVNDLWWLAAVGLAGWEAIVA